MIHYLTFRKSNSPTPDTVFLEACDIYFRHSHNKPYGFFNAELFQQKAAKNLVPLHLRLALIATATRYSSRSQWRERKQSTIDGYARCSWELIVTSQNGLDDTDDVTVIQALALLAVIDATGECCRIGGSCVDDMLNKDSWPAARRVGENWYGSTNKPRFTIDA